MNTGKRIYLSPPHMGGRELDYVQQAFAANFVAPAGPQLAALESAFAERTEFAHCLALSSGTAAIHLALRLLGVGEGDVVIASTLTFIGSVTPATFLGADLHFVDCDPATWNMDPALLAEAIDTVEGMGKRVGAVIPTDLYGQCADYDALRAICEPRGIPLVIDAAEAVGATYKDALPDGAATRPYTPSTATRSSPPAAADSWPATTANSLPKRVDSPSRRVTTHPTTNTPPSATITACPTSVRPLAWASSKCSTRSWTGCGR